MVLLNHNKSKLKDFEYLLLQATDKGVRNQKSKHVFCMKFLKLLSPLVKMRFSITVVTLLIFSDLNVCAKNAEFTPVDRWYEVYLGGAKVGYVSDIMQKDGDVIKSRNEFVMQIKRAGQSIEITVEQETKEKLSGELIDFSVRPRWRDSHA